MGRDNINDDVGNLGNAVLNPTFGDLRNTVPTVEVWVPLGGGP